MESTAVCSPPCGDDERRVTFSVPWVRGKARPRFARGHAYRDDREGVYEDALAMAYLELGVPRLDGRVPVGVSIEVTGRMPRRAPRRVERMAYLGKPDCDNVAKLVLDALNGVAWHDDAQVTELHVVKRVRTRDSRERTTVTVSWKEAERGN